MKSKAEKEHGTKIRLALSRLMDPEYPPAPVGVCDLCWHTEAATVPGEAFVWGWPSTHPGEGPPGYYCTPCQLWCRELGIQLIPSAPAAAGTR